VRRAACAAFLAVGLLAGCGGGGGSAKDVLAKTAANLGKIRSGVLHVELLVTPHGKRLGGPTGFRLDGPFSLSSGGPLPVARISYTQLASGRSATATVVSTGKKGYVQSAGKTYAFTPAQAAQLHAAAGQLGSSGSVSRVVLDRWIRNPTLSDGGQVGGTDTDRVHADLDVVQTVNGLLRLSRSAGVQQISGANADRLSKAVRSSSFDLYTGKKDRLLRRTTIDVAFAFAVPANLRRALGSLVGARIRFVLAVDRPNSPVHVAG